MNMDSVNKWLTLAANLGVFAGIVFSLVLLSSSQLNAQPGVLVGPGDGGKSISAIVSLPRNEAIATALQPEYEDIRPGILNIVFRMWSMEDPIGAFEAYESLPFLDYDNHIEAQILQTWSQTDPTTALEIAATSANADTLPLVLLDVAMKNPEALVSVTEALLSVTNAVYLQIGREEWRAIIRGISSNNPQLAARLVANLGPDNDYLIGSFIGALAREDVVASLQWLMDYYPEGIEYLEAIASIFYIQDSEAAFDFISYLPAGTMRESYEQALIQAQEINQ
jgi:hypothetical protein